jgi:hypothetical protein
MTVRQATYNVLNVAPITTQLPGGLKAAGSLTGKVALRPFAVYRIQEASPQLRGDDATARRQNILQVWVYDEPGSYARIEDILRLVEAQLVQATTIRCVWIGDSGELPDEEQKAIVKNSSYAIREVVA